MENETNIFSDVILGHGSESGSRLYFLTGLCRSIMQHAAICGVEYALENCLEFSDEIADSSSCLFSFNDGDVVRVIDSIVPIIRQAGWIGCTKWFEKTNSDSSRASISLNMPKL
ncbi:hypothetical protein EH221_04815 [bacterium]|nr:MAG: hypothetical protein EH221_04815 [bacterium]